MLWEHKEGWDSFQLGGGVGWWREIGQGRGDMWDLLLRFTKQDKVMTVQLKKVSAR